MVVMPASMMPGSPVGPRAVFAPTPVMSAARGVRATGVACLMVFSPVLAVSSVFPDAC